MTIYHQTTSQQTTSRRQYYDSIYINKPLVSTYYASISTKYTIVSTMTVYQQPIIQYYESIYQQSTLVSTMRVYQQSTLSQYLVLLIVL